jgi:hypothetical protein
MDNQKCVTVLSPLGISLLADPVGSIPIEIKSHDGRYYLPRVLLSLASNIETRNAIRDNEAARRLASRRLPRTASVALKSFRPYSRWR